MNAQALSVSPAERGIAPVVPFEQSGQKMSQEHEVKDQTIRDLKTQIRLLSQAVEAFSDLNRYYASLALGRPATNNEAFIHYVFNGGKHHFDTTHPPSG